MANDIPPVPYKIPVIDNSGLATAPWSDFFRNVLARIGGSSLETSLASPGFLPLPGGLFIQWGQSSTILTAGEEEITFPKEFPNACLQVISGIRNNSAVAVAATGQFGTGNYSASKFKIYNRTSVSHVFNWIAVGY